MKDLLRKVYCKLAGYFDARPPRVQVIIPNLWMGNKHAGFFISPNHLSSDSVVYSFGVGEDVSFDLELIKKFNCNVFAFDPTPKSIKFIQGSKLPESFHFFPFGIMDFDGFLRFFLPENPEFVSGSLANHWGYDESKQPPIEVPVKKLSTIMKELGHRQIDLLKLDIEGAEYAVLNDIISQSVDIKQIVVEFHHRFNGYKSNTVKTVRKLKKKGFKLFAISESKEEYSFLKMP